MKFWNLWEYNFEFLRNIPDRLFSVASWFSELIRLLKVVIFGETSGFLYYIIIMKSLVVTWYAGGSDGCKIPIVIDYLTYKSVIKVECGSQFSMALTKYGVLYTWWALLLLVSKIFWTINRSMSWKNIPS